VRLWQSVLGEVELSISRASYRTWFQNTHLLESGEDKIIVGVPNVFTKKQMEDKYSPMLSEIFKKNNVESKEIVFKISDKPTVSAEEIELTPEQIQSHSTPKQQRSTTKTRSSTVVTAPINGRYTFDSFIIGSSNELAHAACNAVASNPGVKYNPLFLYGGPGLGKTHLIQAVGNHIKANEPDKTVIYVTCEQFVKDFLDYIRYKKKGFSEKYRNADVLIIDDIQFIAGKERTEEEFFHTFNALHQQNKQIILTSDQPPKSIPILEERLRSRFEMGMSVDIQPPDFETRCAILSAKAGESGFELDVETLEFMATHAQNNIRELEGSLNQVIAFCELKNSQPTLDVVKSLMSTQRRQPKRLTTKQVVERTAKHFHIGIDELTGPKRDKDIVVPRQIAMYLLRSELHMSFPKVAAALGRKDHTTAIHSVEKIERNISLDENIKDAVNDIRGRLYA